MVQHSLRGRGHMWCINSGFCLNASPRSKSVPPSLLPPDSKAQAWVLLLPLALSAA